jgi:hypothetical protein
MRHLSRPTRDLRQAGPLDVYELAALHPEGGGMAVSTQTAPRITTVAAHPTSTAGAHYRAAREHAARAPGFAAQPGLNLRYWGGRTIEHLTFTNVYVGGKAKWNADDVTQIDWALAAAMSDPHLNNVIAQYDADGKTSSAFRPSRFLDGPVPARVFRDVIEGFVAGLDQSGALSGFDLATTVFNFMLPRGIVLVDGTSTGHAERSEPHAAVGEHDEAADSKHGLGGYHGSVHGKHGTKKDTVLYAVGVYAEGTNGIVAFDKPWKSICATFYHELCEARTDPDVGDAIRTGNDRLLGWYSARGGEIGDIPLDEAPALEDVMKEVPLTNGSQHVPVQLMWSNAVDGPEGPIAHKHEPAART